MRSSFHTGIVSLGLLLCAGAAYAAPHIVPGTASKGGQPVRTATSAHKLASVIIDNGDPDSSVAAGFTTIDSTTVRCAKPTCTIAIDMSEETGGQSAAGTLWAACGVVDGNYPAEGCPYIGEIPADNTYVSSTARQTFSVAMGKHTVGFQLFTSAAAIAGIFDVQYQVLTP